MNRTGTPLDAVLKGALAGLAGGIAIMLAMQTAEQFIPSPPEPPEGPPPERPREKLVRETSECIFHSEIPEEQEASLAQGLHWIYSAFWGILYGILQPTLRIPELVGGPVLGSLVWTAGPVVLLPRMKLSPPPQDLPLTQVSLNWVFHLIFGLAVAFAYRALSLLDSDRSG